MIKKSEFLNKAELSALAVVREYCNPKTDQKVFDWTKIASRETEIHFFPTGFTPDRHLPLISYVQTLAHGICMHRRELTHRDLVEMEKAWEHYEEWIKNPPRPTVRESMGLSGYLTAPPADHPVQE